MLGKCSWLSQIQPKRNCPNLMNCIWDITNSVVEGSMSIYLPSGSRELRTFSLSIVQHCQTPLACLQLLGVQRCGGIHHALLIWIGGRDCGGPSQSRTSEKKLLARESGAGRRGSIRPNDELYWEDKWLDESCASCSEIQWAIECYSLDIDVHWYAQYSEKSQSIAPSLCCHGCILHCE